MSLKQTTLWLVHFTDLAASNDDEVWDAIVPKNDVIVKYYLDTRGRDYTTEWESYRKPLDEELLALGIPNDSVVYLEICW